jgi:gamma-glutamylcyclotransferase (GGCT)/AIG2-like uncharacterized protein YtfP
MKNKESIDVFVYGTLKQGGRLLNSALRDRLVSVKKATLRGATLYDLGPFPGISLRREEDKGREVIGELHTYKDPEFVINMMDQIEGVGATENTSLFVRRDVVVQTEGMEQIAVVYEAAPNTLQNSFNKEQVTSGEW